MTCRNLVHSVGALLVVLNVYGISPAQQANVLQESTPSTAVPRETVLGTVFLVRPHWDAAIAQTVDRVRATARAERSKDKVICYISVPLSARGGGYRPINVEISRFVKRQLETQYGDRYFWALAPGEVENELPNIGTERPGGGEYLYMWTQILAGEDGRGSDFDAVYFVGPTDVHSFFGVAGPPILQQLDTYVARRAREDVEFRNTIADNIEARRGFLRYYGLRASATFSDGAHDEWNVFALINRRCSIADSISIYFDGRQVPIPVGESLTRPGYEQRN